MSSKRSRSHSKRFFKKNTLEIVKIEYSSNYLIEIPYLKKFLQAHCVCPLANLLKKKKKSKALDFWVSSPAQPSPGHLDSNQRSGLLNLTRGGPKTKSPNFLKTPKPPRWSINGSFFYVFFHVGGNSSATLHVRRPMARTQRRHLLHRRRQINRLGWLLSSSNFP